MQVRLPEFSFLTAQNLHSLTNNLGNLCYTWRWSVLYFFNGILVYMYYSYNVKAKYCILMSLMQMLGWWFWIWRPVNKIDFRHTFKNFKLVLKIRNIFSSRLKSIFMIFKNVSLIIFSLQLRETNKTMAIGSEWLVYINAQNLQKSVYRIKDVLVAFKFY